MHWTEIWDSESPRARLIRIFLAPISFLYALGWRSYLALYQLGLKKPSEPHKPVVCVGSLQVGGSGKTPLTLYLAALLRKLGYEVAIGCSGYGCPASEAAKIAPDGPLKASEWGDEPAMIRELLPEVPLIVGRRRVLAAKLCHASFPNSVLLMDDGFQHLPLQKHLSLLAMPPRKNQRCLP